MAVGEIGIDGADAALGALAFPALLCHHPARFGVLAECPAGEARLFGAVFDFPARDESEEALDAGDADFFLVDHSADAADAFDGAFGEPAVAAIPAGGDDEAFAFVHAEGGD